MMRRFGPLILASLLALQGQSLAQPGFTVQTVALKDYQQALATAQQLRELEFDAYVDFAMFGGEQFARVRVGCFTDREAAASLAGLLKTAVTAEAVVAELSPAAQPEVCLRRDVGFALPQSWLEHLSTPAAVSYRVEVLGRRGLVIFDGERWRLAQSEAEAQRVLNSATPVLAAASLPLFEEQRRDGRPYVLLAWQGRKFVVTSGKLLWQRGPVAIVLEAEAVVAYHALGGLP